MVAKRRMWSEDRIRTLLGDDYITRLRGAEARERATKTVALSDEDLRLCKDYVRRLTGDVEGLPRTNVARSQQERHALSRVVSKMVVESGSFRGQVLRYITSLQTEVDALTDAEATDGDEAVTDGEASAPEDKDDEGHWAQAICEEPGCGWKSPGRVHYPKLSLSIHMSKGHGVTGPQASAPWKQRARERRAAKKSQEQMNTSNNDVEKEYTDATA